MEVQQKFFFLQAGKGQSSKSRPDQESGRPTESGVGKVVLGEGEAKSCKKKTEEMSFENRISIKDMLTPERTGEERNNAGSESSPEERSGKDSRRSTGTRGRYEEAREIIMSLLKGVEGVTTKIKDCGNKRKDIKEAAKRMRHTAERATKAGILQTLESIMRAAEEKRPEGEAERRRTITKEGRETKSASTQTKMAGKASEVNRRKVEVGTQTSKDEKPAFEQPKKRGQRIRGEKRQGTKP